MSLASVRVCVVYIDFDVFVVRDGVVVHYQDSWDPIGELCVGLEEQSVFGEQREAWKTEKNREELRG